jgi:hypothetical protein
VHLVEFPAHESLDREHRVFGVRDRLTLRHLADRPLAFLGKGHDGRGGAGALLVDDDRRLAAFHHGDDRVRRPQVDSNHFAWHLVSPLFLVVSLVLKGSIARYECMSSIKSY